MSSVPGDRWYRLSPEIEQPKKYQPEPSTMNRQVIPSMILSVLIVCSFAIALFERDPDAAGRKPDPRPGGEEEHAAPRRRLPVRPMPERQGRGARDRRSRHRGRRPPVTTEPPRQAEGSREGPPTLHRSRPSAAPSHPGRRRLGPRRPAPAGRRRRPEPAAEPLLGCLAATAPASTVPRAAFTVVQKGETLKDVAVRVYGSSDRLDSLWRANRDVLPRSDSPLTAGAVLRTPGE